MSLNKSITEYKTQLAKGHIQEAYRALMQFMLRLKTHLKAKHSDYYMSGNFYQGYMDMTFFTFTPQSLKEKKLKVAIVFLHESASFEAWLCGVNKQVQKKYWHHIKERGWAKYTIPASLENVESIVETILVETPNFDNLEALTEQIEKGVLEFADSIVNFFAES